MEYVFIPIHLPKAKVLIIMKQLLFVGLISLSVVGFSTDLPKGAEGVYVGVIQSFQFEWQASTYTADEQDVRVVITDNKVIYTAGKVVYSGDINFVAQSKNLYIINAEMACNTKVKIDMQFVYDKKSKELIVKGNKGVPDAPCEKL